MQVDDVSTGDTFDDAALNTTPTNAVAPMIVRQPVGLTNFVGISVGLNALAAGQGLANLTYAWYKNGSLFTNPDGNTNILNFNSPVTTDSGNYTLVVTTPFGLSSTSSVATVLISAAPVPPSFTSQPVSKTVYRGQNVTFSTTVVGPGTISYQWKSNNVDISGETSSTLTLANVTTNNSGNYRVGVSNEFGGVLSTNAVLTVLNPPLVTINFLRHLVDSSTYQSTNTTLPYEIIGTVTTLTNITTGNTASYYLQDGTGGINIFATSGSTFRPQLGDVVDFIGVVSSFSSGLELYADTLGLPFTSYTILSNNLAGLPAPLVVPYTITNNADNLAYNILGRVVQLTNVYFGTNAGTVLPTNNTYVIVTNASGLPFKLFFPNGQDLDSAGATLPAFATSVSGVMYGDISSTNVSVMVDRWSQVNTNVSVSPIPLTIVKDGTGNVVVSWSDASFNLQAAVLAAGPYTNVSGATSPYTNTIGSGATFFRLIH